MSSIEMPGLLNVPVYNTDAPKLCAGDPEGRVKHAVDKNYIQRWACSFALVHSAFQMTVSNERGNMLVL
jgi:hypothetical protein